MALHSRDGSDWSVHIAGAKMVVTSLSRHELELLTSKDEGANLYQCLEYHDVLARFGLQHWTRHGGGEGSAVTRGEGPAETIVFEVGTLGAW